MTITMNISWRLLKISRHIANFLLCPIVSFMKTRNNLIGPKAKNIFRLVHEYMNIRLSTDTILGPSINISLNNHLIKFDYSPHEACFYGVHCIVNTTIGEPEFHIGYSSDEMGEFKVLSKNIMVTKYVKYFVVFSGDIVMILTHTYSS